MNKICNAQIGERPIKLKILSTPEERSVGYQNQEVKPAFGEGLLFYFICEESQIFHMENVNFDLDLLGFDQTGKLICNFPMKAEAGEKYETPPCKIVVEAPHGWAAGLVPEDCHLRLSKL